MAPSPPDLPRRMTYSWPGSAARSWGTFRTLLASSSLPTPTFTSAFSPLLSSHHSPPLVTADVKRLTALFPCQSDMSQAQLQLQVLRPGNPRQVGPLLNGHFPILPSIQDLTTMKTIVIPTFPDTSQVCTTQSTLFSHAFSKTQFLNSTPGQVFLGERVVVDLLRGFPTPPSLQTATSLQCMPKNYLEW